MVSRETVRYDSGPLDDDEAGLVADALFDFFDEDAPAVSAEGIARLADDGKRVTGFYRGEGRMVRPQTT